MKYEMEKMVVTLQWTPTSILDWGTSKEIKGGIFGRNIPPKMVKVHLIVPDSKHCTTNNRSKVGKKLQKLQ